MTINPARLARPIACTALLLSGLAACGERQSADDEMRDTVATSATVSDSAGAMSGAIPPTGSTTMANSALNDTSVVHLIAAIDRGEANAGRLAATKATRPDVKAYARMMLQEHTADLTRLEQLATNAGITLDTSDATRAAGSVPTTSGSGNTAGAVVQLEQNQQQTVSRLQVASGTDFTRQYLDSQLAGHQQVLDLLRRNESRLENPAIRMHATAMASAVEKHIERARQLQTKIRADSAAAATMR